MSTYTLAFFFDGPWRPDAWDRLTTDDAKRYEARALRGNLKPMTDHFCGMDCCKKTNDGCRTMREFGTHCIFVGDYSWPDHAKAEYTQEEIRERTGEQEKANSARVSSDGGER
jgi:hypothetical protein